MCHLHGQDQELSVLWSLRLRNRAAAATCGRGRCELPAIVRATPKIASGWRFFGGRQSEKPCDFCSGMVASPLAATVVTAILRCDFCAAKSRDHSQSNPQHTKNPELQDYSTCVSDFSGRECRNPPPTWVIHMLARAIHGPIPV